MLIFDQKWIDQPDGYFHRKSASIKISKNEKMDDGQVMGKLRARANWTLSGLI